MRASEIAAVGLAALALCCLATIYPALLASRMRPVRRPAVRVRESRRSPDIAFRRSSEASPGNPRNRQV